MYTKLLHKLAALAGTAALALSLAACGGEAAAPSETPADSSVKLGVIQYAPHPSLDNCYTGLIQGLAAAGYVEGDNLTVDFQNAMGEGTTSDLMAKNMVTTGCDLLVGIATPAAMSAYSAARDADVPVVFSAVSDPLSAGLVQSLDAPGTGATGTADALNLEGQLALIRALLPQAETIGILYTMSEPNSVSQLATISELAPAHGFSIVSQGVNQSSEVAAGAAALVAKGVDCINNFTDNNVVNNLSTLLHAADAAGIPVFGSEEEQVKNGCVASETLDYVALGVETGRLAAAILSGEAEADALPVSIISSSAPVYSTANCAKFGISIPDSYAHATDLDG